MGRISGKVALVTGAGSTEGIGHSCVTRLAQEGATVFACDIDVEQGTAAAHVVHYADHSGRLENLQG